MHSSKVNTPSQEWLLTLGALGVVFGRAYLLITGGSGDESSPLVSLMNLLLSEKAGIEVNAPSPVTTPVEAKS